MSKIWKQMLGIGASVACIAVLASDASAQTNCNASVGPDVIVGDITGPQNYAADSGFEALSLGTYSCNIGDFWLNWFAGNNNHPVIGGALWRYRIVDGTARFEQVGQSWLKHGFFALSNTLCCTGCQGTDGTHLGVHCADPYTAARNGSQGPLGPRWQVNANTGAFNYPPANPAWAGSTARRLEVDTADLATSDLYFGECVYVSPDDAAAGNQNNNASYRQLQVTGSGSAWTFSFMGTTQREKEAPRAWQAVDPTVSVSETAVPNEGGVIILSWKVTDLGGGQWRYEYLVYNQNSDRSGQSFSIPVPATATVTNIGFHDVSYRWGDGPSNVNFSGTDWTSLNSGGTLSWATQTWAQNQSANAIRWQTGYNFRFDANVAPALGNATIGLFKPGTPSSISVLTEVPAGDPPVAVGTPSCIGFSNQDATCPCAAGTNPGGGCGNESATTGHGGSLLEGSLISGTSASISDDGDGFQVLLDMSLSPPGKSAIVLQGTTTITPVFFFDGVRCTGGSLLRLNGATPAGDLIAGDGTLTYPNGVHKQSIVNRCVSLGQPILPGETRYYFVQHRVDASPNACIMNQTGNANTTNALAILWGS